MDTVVIPLWVLTLCAGWFLGAATVTGIGVYASMKNNRKIAELRAKAMKDALAKPRTKVAGPTNEPNA